MGGSKSKSSSKTTTEIPAEIRERGTKITNAAMGTYFDPAQKYESFDYNNYSGVGQDLTGQLNERHDAAGNAITGANGAFQQAGSSYQPYFGRADTTMGTAASENQVSGPNFTAQNLERFQNPYQQNVIDQGVRQISDNMTQGRLQNQSRAALAGAFGGSRHGVIDAEGQKNAMSEMSDFIGSQLAQGYDKSVQQYNTDFTQDMQAKGQNFNQGVTTANFLQNLGKETQGAQIAAGDAQLRGADADMKLGNIQTAQEEAQKQNAYEYGYKDKRDYPMEVYERLAAMNAMQPVNRTSTSTGTQKSSGGWLGPALQAAGSVAMMSDEDMKEDIRERDPEEALGAFAKMRTTKYTYKDEAKEKYPELAAEGERRGFMAQDYEKEFGEPAGPETEDGFKTVDIPNMLGDLVAAVQALSARTESLAPKKRRA